MAATARDVETRIEEFLGKDRRALVKQAIFWGGAAILYFLVDLKDVGPQITVLHAKIGEMAGEVSVLDLVRRVTAFYLFWNPIADSVKLGEKNYLEFMLDPPQPAGDAENQRSDIYRD